MMMYLLPQSQTEVEECDNTHLYVAELNLHPVTSRNVTTLTCTWLKLRMESLIYTPSKDLYIRLKENNKPVHYNKK